MLSAEQFDDIQYNKGIREFGIVQKSISDCVDVGYSNVSLPYLKYRRRYKVAVLRELREHGFWCRWNIRGNVLKWRTTRPLFCNLWYAPIEKTKS